MKDSQVGHARERQVEQVSIQPGPLDPGQAVNCSASVCSFVIGEIAEASCEGLIRYFTGPASTLFCFCCGYDIEFSSVHFHSVVQSCPTHCNPMNHSTQASLSITNSRSPPKPMSIESVMPSNHLILCCPLLLLLPIFPSIRVFSNETALHIRWPKYWSFSFIISLFNE